MKRAQAAMEFMLTYGWSILVIVAVFSAFAYFGVYRNSDVMPYSCNFMAPTPCVDTPTIRSDTEQIVFTLRNNVGGEINITDYVYVSEGCTSFDLVSVNGLDTSVNQVNIKNGKTMMFTINCSDLEKGRSKAEIHIKYINLQSHLEKTVHGYITGLAS